MMSQSTLRQVLTIFENADGPLSMTQIARELDVSVPRLEGMLRYWVRKGKLRETGSAANCGTCGSAGACPFVLDLPRGYELASAPQPVPLDGIAVTCNHSRALVPERDA